jgi:hypothetical protein
MENLRLQREMENDMFHEQRLASLRYEVAKLNIEHQILTLKLELVPDSETIKNKLKEKEAELTACRETLHKVETATRVF